MSKLIGFLSFSVRLKMNKDRQTNKNIDTVNSIVVTKEK